MKSSKSIVLVHGLFGSLNEPDLHKAINLPRIEAPDLLGYGALSATPLEQVHLNAQVSHLHKWITSRFSEPVHLLGHSVGGAVALLFTSQYPGLVASLTSVEGNFTLGDAFWSSKVAKMNDVEVNSMVEGFKSDVAGWITSSGLPTTRHFLELGKRWLENQPALTVRSMAKSVVSVTAEKDYLDRLKHILNLGIPLHLIAGERSAAGWDIPSWIRAQALRTSVIPGTGHMMMFEKPNDFGSEVRDFVSTLSSQSQSQS